MELRVAFRRCHEIGKIGRAALLVTRLRLRELADLLATCLVLRN